MGYRAQVNRANVGNNNGEILNKFNWDLEVTKRPAIVYWPGDMVYFNRLKDISGLPDDQVSIEDVEVGGGFTITQTGDSANRQPVEVTFNFQDYEDSTIGYLVHDWKIKIQDPVTRRSFRKADLVADMVAYQLNTDLIPVKAWYLYNGMISSGSTNDDSFTNKKEISGQVNMAVKFEWWDIKWLNK